MQRIVLFFPLFLFLLVSHGQEARLPADLRQHNLVGFNSSLFNPVFSMDRNEPESVAFWTRWQWQMVDGDPTTLFLNYTRRLNERSTAGAAFFQHNTGVYFNTGGVLNYAYELHLTPTIKLAFGANLFGFKQKLADDRFLTDPGIPFPQLRVSNDFILQMAPGVRLSVERLSFSLASENLLDYNFALKESNTEGADKIFMGMLSYDLPLPMQVPNAYLRPSLYLRTVPGEANQIGLNTYLSTSKYWGQLGYNNFYGLGLGGGGTFFQKVSLGAVVEFGTNTSVKSKDPSFEIVAAYFFGTPDQRYKVADYSLVEKEIPVAEKEAETDKPAKEEIKAEKELKKAEREKEKELKKAERAHEKTIKDSLALAKRANAATPSKKEQERERIRVQDSIDQAKKAEKERLDRERAQDSINQVRALEEEAAKIKAEQERIAQEAVEDKPKTGERYEEVESFEGLEPGYYLIANVFGTKKYFEAFMKDLSAKGIQAGSFYRSSNKFNYVYLGRYDTMNEARQARDSNFDGKYPEKTWVFRVVK